ncbi:hypothetical protein ACLKA6_016548 [Drosophila palustris]
MLLDRTLKRFSCALPLFVLTVYLLLVVPALGHAGSAEAAKEELHLRELEPKLEADSEMLSEHGTGPSLTRFGGNRRAQRSIGFGTKFLQISRSKLPMELGILVDPVDDERPKRYDDYGHMRFGKRGGDEQFDDYGHMRFGR